MKLFHNLKNKYWRLSRHALAFIKYGSIRKLFNIATVEWERISRKIKLKGKPYIIVVDPMNACNLKCPFCPTGLNKLPYKAEAMSVEGYKKVINQIAPWTIKIIMYNNGEPYLHPRINEMVKYNHDKGLSTVISSNLNKLPDGGGEAVVKSGLDDLIVSCDGLTQDTYEKYRRGGKLSDVLQNIESIVNARRKLGKKNPVIEVQFLVFQHNEHEVLKVEKFFRDMGADFVRLTKPYVDLNSEEIKKADNPDYVKDQYLGETKEEELSIFNPDTDAKKCAKKNPPPLKCYWPWRSMVINSNGLVDPCCFVNYRKNFGNIFEKEFEEIWNGEEYLYARGWIGGKVEFEDRFNIVCRGCRGYE
jgi:MoaA/NifB/PqqE/SkfB family radical SAM enzyme